MPTPTELLQEIKDHLADLPERLAAAMAKSPNAPPSRDEFGRFVGKSGTGTNPPGLGVLDSTQRLGHALGRFLPIFGELASLLGNVRELGAASQQFGRSLGSLMPSKQLGQAMQPPDEIPGTTEAPSLGTQPGADRAGWIQAMSALQEALDRNTEAQEQEAPDMQEDVERLRAAKARGTPEQQELEKAGKVVWQSGPGFSKGARPPEPMRPEKKVPSSKDSEGGIMKTIAEMFA